MSDEDEKHYVAQTVCHICKGSIPIPDKYSLYIMERCEECNSEMKVIECQRICDGCGLVDAYYQEMAVEQTTINIIRRTTIIMS